jgi:hypothetical protein
MRSERSEVLRVYSIVLFIERNVVANSQYRNAVASGCFDCVAFDGGTRRYRSGTDCLPRH